jgi:uroporphyrinogen-III synthase
MASIGPVTSATLRELGLPVDIAAKEFTIPGLVAAIVKSFAARH